jgi:hypothetical protein
MARRGYSEAPEVFDMLTAFDHLDVLETLPE